MVDRGAGGGAQRPWRTASAGPEQVAAIGLDCTACTVRGLRLRGKRRSRPALLWMDQRSFREAETISATGDPVLRYVSGRVSPEWMLPKALWLKRNKPETYRRAGQDRRVHRLDDAPSDRPVDALAESCRGQVELRPARRRLAAGLLTAVGLGDLPAKWPDRIVPLGRGEARLDAAAAADLGLNAGTPVAQGGIDAYLGMLGLGATKDGDVAVIVGSSTCHLAESREGVFGSGAAGCYPDATVEGLYTIEAGQTATGSILDWYRRHFAGRQRQRPSGVASRLPGAGRAGRRGSARRRGTGGPRRLAGQPFALQEPAGPRARSSGLSLAHGPGHVFRAIYEATACGTRHILEDAATHGLAVERIFIGGGGARSALWLQIHADILKKPVHLARESESCALGSAMAAAVAAGIYRRLRRGRPRDGRHREDRRAQHGQRHGL